MTLDVNLPAEPESSTSSVDGKLFLKPPFGYFGAKQRMASRIIEMLPPHNAWVEVFCGSAVVTLNKPAVGIEVLNDLDEDIVNLFYVLRDQSSELIRAVSLTPYSRFEFEQSRGGRSGLDALERARRFLVATMMTVNGSAGSVHSGFSKSDSYVRGGREARVNRWYQLPDRLAAIVERLRSVRIEKIDARELVRQFSQRPATLLYLDPPYLMTRTHTYATDANSVDFHEELLSECIRAKCMIIVSGYQSALYSKFLNRSNGWSSRTLETTTRGVEGIDKVRTEKLWMNESFRTAKAKSTVPIRLTPTETKQNKVNPRRGAKSELIFTKSRKYGQKPRQR